jgi:hypothetical protein
MKIGIAAAFRHNLEEDGKTIPASRGVEVDYHGYDYYVLPIIGYIAYTVDGKTVNWSFMKYECAEVWHNCNRGNRPAQIATTRVGKITCPKCGSTIPYPIRKDTSKTRCPYCGSYNLQVEPIKENSQEFLDMVGDLKDPLEQAAKVALKTGNDFAFPDLLVAGRNLETEKPASIPSEIFESAVNAGYGLRYMDSVPLNELNDIEDINFHIIPGIYSGCLDSKKANGVFRQVNSIEEYISLYIPKAKKLGFKDVRF